ncbi:MAG TPA: tetratricopeptide repeat-containing serine protease family protein [Pyrinomonadaceae bacterium]|nr:tetratricopeptide repeat-containing serine protease family protein [Pyrinomonadaceae bacterium]
MHRRIFPQLLLIVLAFVSVDEIFCQENLPELVRRAKPSVVAIVTYDSKGEPLLTGSGFFVGPGQIVTNLHVMRRAHRAEIKTLDGKGRFYPVIGALAVDEDGDLALLSVPSPPERTRTVELSTSLPEEGEKIFVIGNPLKLEGSVSDGIVSAIREVPGVGKIVQVTAPISHGNSGSPVFNLKGQVVGVVTVKVTNGQNINLAIAAARLQDLRPGKVRELNQLPVNVRGGDMADALYRRGLDSMWLGNYDSALGFFENAVNRNPQRADAWIQVGYCKVKQGRNEEAIQAYQQALQLRPESEEAHNKLGDAYYFAGRFNEAIDSYNEAARLSPDSAEAYYNLALTYFEIGNQQLASRQSRILRQLDEKLYEKYLIETGNK